MSLAPIVPPPLLALIAASLMWWIDQTITWGHMSIPYGTPMVYVLSLLGLSLIALCLIHFRLSKTTVNPHHPEKTRVLITSGLYRLSRNPMYLGLLLLLLAWWVQLEQLLAIPVLFLFIWTIHRLQIKPEERRLQEKFGDDYKHYCKQTRRWI